MPRLLEYQTHTSIKPKTWLLVVARTCAIVPLVFGVLCLIVFFTLPGWKEFAALAGLRTLVYGNIPIFAGVVCTIVYWAIERRNPHLYRKDVNQQFASTMMLLLANYVVGFVCIAIAMLSFSGLD